MGSVFVRFKLLVLASLGLLTFGIARVLFVQPYYYLAKSGWHIYLFRMADELSDADINAYRAQNAERNGKR